MRSCLAFSISLGVAAFLCDGMDGMVDAARIMGEFIRRAAILNDGSMVDCFVVQDDDNLSDVNGCVNFCGLRLSCNSLLDWLNKMTDAPSSRLLSL